MVQGLEGSGQVDEGSPLSTLKVRVISGLLFESICTTVALMLCLGGSVCPVVNFRCHVYIVHVLRVVD